MDQSEMMQSTINEAEFEVNSVRDSRNTKNTKKSKWVKPGTAARPYYDDEEEEHMQSVQSQSAIMTESYNIAESARDSVDQSQVSQSIGIGQSIGIAIGQEYNQDIIENIKKAKFQHEVKDMRASREQQRNNYQPAYQEQAINEELHANQRAISALKIRPGVFSDDGQELAITSQPTAQLVKEDSELNQLQGYTPGKHQMITISDDQEGARQIDELYEMRNSQQRILASQDHGDDDGQGQARQRLERQLMIEESDIYPPTTRPYEQNIQQQQQPDNEMPYNPNFNEIDEPAMTGASGSMPYQQRNTNQLNLKTHDSILDNTPSHTAFGTGLQTDLYQQAYDQHKQQTQGGTETDHYGGQQDQRQSRQTDVAESLESKLDQIKGIFQAGTTEQQLQQQVSASAEVEDVRPGYRNGANVNVENVEYYTHQLNPADQHTGDFGSAQDSYQEASQGNNQAPTAAFNTKATAPGPTVSGGQNEQEFEPESYQPPQTPRNPQAALLDIPKPALDERRPHSNVPAKQRELEELARLIQAATGTVDLAVETSQQLSSQNQIYQRFAERTAAKQKQGQVVESGDNLHKITKQIDEANHNDNQILSDLDMIIHNLENQQQTQSKFSSNQGFVSQLGDKKLEQKYEQQITESLNIEKQGSAIEEELTPEVANAQTQGQDDESNNIRQSIQLDTDPAAQIMRMQRPISSKSGKSNSTRYGTGKAAHQKQDYEQFEDEEEAQEIQMSVAETDINPNERRIGYE